MYIKIQEIYDSYVQETKGKDSLSLRVQEKIQDVLREKKQELGWREFEQYRDQVYEVSFIAEKAGFINGFKYAVRLMGEGASCDSPTRFANDNHALRKQCTNIKSSEKPH